MDCLSLELAAARIKLLPPQALLSRLSHRLSVLTGGPRDLPTRQQALRNTLQWSYDLLNAQEKYLFRQLAVFTGGCTLEAAAAVVQASSITNRAGGDTPLDVFEGVASLIDKSLLLQTEREGEEPRLLMREYGLEALAASSETQAARGAHAAYYLRLAEEAEPRLLGAEQARWLDRLERDHENLRAALSWLIEQEALETALRLGATLGGSGGCMGI